MHCEMLERRQLLHGGVVGDPVVVLPPAEPVIDVPLNANPRAERPSNLNFSLLPFAVTGITQTGTGANTQLVAQAKLGSETFQIPLTLTGEPGEAAGEVSTLQEVCDILNLEIGAINLDLLGLVVETSDICLDITAQEGGGLLGDLLCGIAGLLDDGINLGDILGDLTPEQITALFDGLTDLLTGVLGQIFNAQNVIGVSDSGGGVTPLSHGGPHGGPGAGECDILNLALGPVDLNLLGLNVALDDCDGGPVTVDITAERGQGNLLGNLLCGLTGILDGQGGNNALIRQLDRIADALEGLLN
jgi:hypothetical protein